MSYHLTRNSTRAIILWFILINITKLHFALALDNNLNNKNSNKLLLILVDGCRWDYPDQDKAGLPGFRKLAENGVRAPYATPIFPANSYPNWYTLVTGLYAESHGFVQNMMYDSEYNDFFLMAPNETADVEHWWQGAEPIWVTAEKHGLRSALYWWDGCQVEIRGRKPTYCEKYKYEESTVNQETKDAMSTALELFENDEIQLVQIYYEPVDAKGHKFGPDSMERKQAMKDIDTLLDNLQTEMINKNLHDKVNIVVVSDHGMTSTVTPALNLINLQDIVDVSDIRYMVYSGATSMILPQDGKLRKLYESLRTTPGLNVYLKEDIPEKYHLKNNRLILPLLLVASKNYYIQGLNIPGKSIPSGGSTISPGSHGYDPDEVHDMRGIFFARGPGLKENYVTPPLRNVDAYNVLCELLGIEPLPNNGSKALTNGMLAYSSANRQLISPLLTGISFIIFLNLYFRTYFQST